MKQGGQKLIANIGIIIGLLGGLTGMAVAIAAAPIPGTILSLVFILVFGLTFGRIFYRGYKSKKLLQTGTRANGRILEVYDTGVTVNNQPQIGIKLEVTPVAGTPFTAEIKLIISRLQTSYYQPGLNCVVRYDPNNKKSVAIESLGESISGHDSSFSSSNISPYFPGKNKEQIEEIIKGIADEEKRIRSTGKECRAVIKTSDWTNIYMDGNNEFRFFELAVMPDNMPAYDAKCYGLIMQNSLSKFSAGKEIWVKYDPSDKTKVILSHS
ncbi:MAG: DUF3592 domain-containing protein [Ignavibacteria bacterium]|jgi:hypothetical protein|nr:DUF3592 domain-containing protein [Ignavibacteria bacterium]